MIFVTVGTQLPFDRMIRAVDEWAGVSGRRDVLAQVGMSDYRSRNIKCVKTLHPEEFQQRFMEAEFIISHAGMGSIITAMELSKPIIILPRRAELGEHRNDHQLATAKRFADMGLVSVAFHEGELAKRIDALMGPCEGAGIEPRVDVGTAGTCNVYDERFRRTRHRSEACPNLLGLLRGFIDGNVSTAGTKLASSVRHSRGSDDLHHHSRS